MGFAAIVRSLTVIVALCVGLGVVQADHALSPYFFGTNLWADQDVGGQAYLFWPQLKKAGIKLVRIGGIGYNDQPPSMQQLLAWIDSIRAIGAEPLIQVSSHAQTPAQCADVVRTINVTHNLQVRFWTIGNEPWIDNNATTATDIMNYWKPRATAMKAVEPTIKLFGIDECYYKQDYYTALIGGSNDISGQDENGNDYIDYVAFHTYPFPGSDANAVYTRDQVVKQGIAGIRGMAQNAVSDLSKANLKHDRSSARQLGWALTEFNITYANPANNSIEGVGTRSFLAGQFIAAIFGVGMELGAFTILPWSIFEGGSGGRTDLGMFDAAPGYQPRSYYYHLALLGEYFSGTVCSTATNQEFVKAMACRNQSRISVMLLNMAANSGFDYAVGLNGSDAQAHPALEVTVDAQTQQEYTGHIDAQSTVVLVFTADGTLSEDAVYSLTDAQQYQPPQVHTYTTAVRSGHSLDTRGWLKTLGASRTQSIRMTLGTTQAYCVQLFLPDGSRVLTERGQGADVRISTKGIMPGVYLINLQTRDGKATGRFVIP